MQFQMVCFAVAVVVCVAWTRLTYYDGLHGQIQRLRRHCKIHAVMIAAVSAWAMSIGFYVAATSQQVIDDQQQTIQNLATGRNNSTGEHNAGHAQQIAHTVAVKAFEITTPEGISLAWTIDGNRSIPALRSVPGGTQRIQGGSDSGGSGVGTDTDDGGSAGGLRGQAESGRLF